MPLYELKCGSCGHRFERIVKFSDPPVKSCPHCGKDAVEQVISAPAVQFKGSGWYVSDYARKKTPGAPASAASEGGDVSAAKEGAPKEGAPKEGAAKEGAAKEGAAKEGSSAPESGASAGKTLGSGPGGSSAGGGGSSKSDAAKGK